MRFVTFFSLFCLSLSQYAYYPKICPMLPESLQVCAGTTYTYTLQAADPLNSAYTCSPSTSPESCTFVRLTSSGTTDNFSITSSGVISYTPVTSDSTKTFVIGLYDTNAMSSSFNFPYFSMTDTYSVQFTVTDPSTFPSINCDSNSNSCVTGSSCSTCITLSCGGSHIGLISIPSVSDTNRFTFTLSSSSGVTIALTSGGGFVITSVACSSSGISWSITVYDQSTGCSSTLSYGPYTLNTAPSINITTASKYYTYSYTGFQIPALITDTSHTYSQLTVTLTSTDSFVASAVTAAYTFTITPASTAVLAAQVSLTITVTDSGVSGVNVMSTAVTVTVYPVSAVVVTSQIAYQYAGTWSYDPAYSLSTGSYYLSISTTATGLYLINNQTGTLAWESSSLDLQSAGTVFSVVYSVVTAATTYTTVTAETSLSVTVASPPIINAVLPVVSYYGCTVSTSLPITFYDLTALTYTFTDFTPTLTTATTSASITWTLPASGSPSYTVAVASTYQSNTFTSSISMSTALYTYASPAFSLSSIVVPATSSYSLDLTQYIDFTLVETLSFSLADSTFAVSSGGILSATSSGLVTALGVNTLVTDSLVISVLSQCGSTTTWTILATLITAEPSIDFTSANFQCLEETLCTFNLLPYVTTSGLSLSSSTYANLPTLGTVATTTSSITWTPPSTVSSSGDIAYTAVIGGITVSSTFYITVYKLPLLLPPRIQDYTLAIGTSYSYVLQYFSYYGNSVTCTCSFANTFKTNPSYTDSTKTLSWSSPTSSLSTTGTVSSLSATFSCHESVFPSSNLQDLTITIPFLTKCSIGSLSTLTAEVGLEWSVSVSVTFYNSFSSIAFTYTTGPVGLSVELSSSSGEVYSYALKWTPTSTGSDSLVLQCTEYFSSINSLSNTATHTLTVNVYGPVFNDNCSGTQAIIGVNYSCVLSVTSAISCAVQPTSSGVSASYSCNSCTISWSSSDIATYGMNVLSLTVTINDSYGNTASLGITLCPNDRPSLSSISSSYEVAFGLVPFSLQLVVTDSQSLVYAVTTGPSGLSVSSAGLITYTTPLTGTVPSTSAVVVTVTDTAMFPLSVQASFAITSSSILTMTSPVCPAAPSVVVGVLWTLQVTVPTDYTFTYTDFPGTVDSSNLMSWTPATNSPVTGICLVFEYQDSYRSCSFSVYPNHLPVIVSASAFSQANTEDFYYRVSYSDVENTIDELSLMLSSSPSGMVLLDSYGMVHWPYASMTVGTQSFTISVTDQGTPPATVSVTFTIVVYTPTQPPNFIAPTMIVSNPIKQYLVTGYTQATAGSITVKVSDSDTPLSGLGVSLGSFNPYGLVVSQDSNDLSTYYIQWTPSYLQLSSGVVGVTVYEIADTGNKDYFELIIYSITVKDFAPIFVGSLPQISISEYDASAISIYFTDYDSTLNSITVAISSTEGLALKGKDAVYRSPSYISAASSGTYTITICSTPITACTSQTSSIQVTTSNSIPVLNVQGNTVFSASVLGDYSPVWELQSTDIDGDAVTYCTQIVSGTPTITAYGSNLLWTGVGMDSPNVIFQVTAVDDGTCVGDTSYNSETIEFCIEYTCTLVFRGSLTISISGNYIEIDGLDSDSQVLFISRYSSCNLISGSLYLCDLPTGIMLMDPVVFIENSEGLSLPYETSLNNVAKVTSQMAIAPAAGLGIALEVITITLTPSVELDFRCYVESTSTSSQYEAVLYNNDYAEFYCVLPALSQGTYSVILYEWYSHISYSYSYYYVRGIPTMTAPSPFEGHSYGGYSTTITVDLKGWTGSVFLSFGYFQIVQATTLSSTEISVIVPPQFDLASATVLVYLSPTSNPYSWSSSTITFTYTGSCNTAGSYCNGNQILQCPIGYYCPSGSTPLFSPLPCPAGFYQDQTGQASCAACPVGSMCNSDASAAAQVCEAGFICDRLSIDTPRIMCPPGYYCEEGTNTQAVNNGANYYEQRSANIITGTDHWIVRGSYCASTNTFNYVPFTPQCISQYLTGAVSASTPVPPQLCPDNTYCLLATKSSTQVAGSQYTPQSCTNGYTCTAGDGESFDNSNTCSTGSFCPTAGYSGVFCVDDTPSCTTCLCPAGYACPYESLTTPTICSPGSYQPDCGEAVCISCDANYYCDSSGLTAPVGLCQAGFMCPQGTASPKPCDTGSYNALEGQSACTACPVGYYCASQSMTAPTICNSGYICNEIGMSMQTACPEGYYCPVGTNSSDTGDCATYDLCPQPCKAGYQCPLASPMQIACSIGSYQALPMQPECSLCETGYYCPNSTLTAMTPCPAGYYCSIAELSDTSGICPGGYYCLEGTASGTFTYRMLSEVLCDTASLLQHFGGVLPKQPIPCPKGTYCPAGTSSGVVGTSTGPKQCEENTYSSNCASLDCTDCDAGYYCPGLGTVYPILCSAGTYRSGVLVISCVSCPPGTWSGGKLGLGTADDCAPCPAGYLCSVEGIYEFAMMAVCSAGFYCPLGSSALINYCPAGYICPPGLSDSTKYDYPCLAGYICPSGTGISLDMLALCLSGSSQCIVGSKCGRGYFCQNTTAALGINCPDGTYSDEGSTNIYDCYPDSSVAEVFNITNIVNTTAFTAEIQVEPLTYTKYSFSNLQYPNGTNPTDYTVVLDIVGSTSYKIPFVQVGSYSPIYRLPLANYYSAIMSSKNSTLEIAILAHKTVSLKFTVEFLNGIYNYDILEVKFASSVSFISTQYSARYNENSFLSVLNRNSQNSFKPPINLAIHQVLPTSATGYSSDIQTLVDSVSVSVISGIDLPTESLYSQSTFDFWSSLNYDQKLYPLDYLPYITDCEGYGAYVPLYLLFASDQCTLVSSDSTVSVSILTPLTVPVGDYCNYNLTCRTSEKISTSDTLEQWFDSYELSTSLLFYLSRVQFDMNLYAAAIPNLTAAANSFSTDFYGSSGIVGVSSVRTATGYSIGMIPKQVRLYVGYYQKNKIDKEILMSVLYFEKFSSDLSDRSYTFIFDMEALAWKQCLDLFAFEEYLYYIFVIMVCFVIFLIVVTFWLVNYIFSTILPRPSLKIMLYLNYSIRAIKGIHMVVFPVFGLIFSCYYILNSLDILKSIPGSYYDNEPIDPNSANDSTRITKYLSGRLGTCICIIGLYMIFKASDMMFAEAKKADSMREIPEINKEVKRLRGLFLWSLVPVLIFSLTIYQFAKSDIYVYLQTLFIVLFKLTNTRIVEMNRGLFDDELYVLAFYGAMTLAVMLVTIKVGAFTTFLTGYLTNILIKIAKRTFLEPYRIEIKNQILKFKQRFKLGGGDGDDTSGLGFKDRVYIEQVSDLGANSVESIAAWLFPTLIVFNYVLYSELQLAIAKDFLKYFIVFCFLQALADISYDIFLNNAIECRTGRLLSEKITEIKSVFDHRRCLWALSDKSPHSGRNLVSALDNLVRMGFSTQYFFLMTLGILGTVLEIYAVELWATWSYNPFEDPAAIFLMATVIIICVSAQISMIWIGRVFKLWKLKENLDEKVLDFNALVKMHLVRVINEQDTMGKEDLIYYSMAEIVLECYDKENNEKKRKGNIIRFLKDLDNEINKKPEKGKDIDLDSLPLPKIRQRSNQRIMKIRQKIEVTPLKNYGTWPSELRYSWPSPKI